MTVPSTLTDALHECAVLRKPNAQSRIGGQRGGQASCPRRCPLAPSPLWSHGSALSGAGGLLQGPGDGAPVFEADLVAVLESGGELVLVGDEYDAAELGLESVQFVDHVTPALLVQGAEAFVDDDRLDAPRPLG